MTINFTEFVNRIDDLERRRTGRPLNGVQRAFVSMLTHENPSLAQAYWSYRRWLFEDWPTIEADLAEGGWTDSG